MTLMSSLTQRLFNHLPIVRTFDWHNRLLPNWELKIRNFYYKNYVKTLSITHYPSPITNALRSVTLQGAECGFYCSLLSECPCLHK